MIAWWLAGVLIALFWAGRLRDGAGLMKLPDITAAEWDNENFPHASQSGLPRAPAATIVVPARNEEPAVERCLRSLVALDYPEFNIIAVDDRSTDGTGAIMERLAAEHRGAPGICVLKVRELPPGWLGKPHAMWLATETAAAHAPEWFLFTDADVTFRPDALRRAIAYAEAEAADHLVVFPTYQVRGLGEKVALAGFQMLFAFGHRPWKVADPKADDFMGLGPFNLIRRSAYEQVGGFRALRMEVIEDMKLGKLVKQHGLAQRNVFGPGLLPWRWASGALGLSRVLTKNMFALMQFRWGKALGACALLLVLNLLPLVGAILARGWARAPFVAALGFIALMHVGMGRRTPAPWWTFVFYPLATLLMVTTMMRSMLHVLRHGGVVWRGTRYGIAELRRGCV